MKRLGVLGTLVWDTIHHPLQSGRPPVEQWGGLTYSLTAFAALCPPGWTIHPIIRIGSDLGPQAREMLGRLLPEASQDGVVEVAERTNRVELRYLDDAERTERLTGGVSGWDWPALRPRLEGLDALFVNYIAGYEMDLETAEQLREAFDQPIYADVHSLCLGPPGDGPRAPRRLENPRRWLATADYLQVNAFELDLIGGDEGLPEARHVGKPPFLLITLGGEGAVARQRVRGTIQEVEVPLPDGPVAGDPTGCGDIWGAAVFCGILEGKPLSDAMRRGHAAARARLEHVEISRLVDAIREEAAS